MTLRSIVSKFFTLLLFFFMVAAAAWTVRDIYGRFKLSERMDGMRAELRQEDVEVSFSDGQSFVVKYGSIHKGYRGESDVIYLPNGLTVKTKDYRYRFLTERGEQLRNALGGSD